MNTPAQPQQPGQQPKILPGVGFSVAVLAVITMLIGLAISTPALTLVGALLLIGYNGVKHGTEGIVYTLLGLAVVAWFYGDTL